MGRRTKKGFTLTEVLLAMSIIGVISALVMPQLVKTIQKVSKIPLGFVN